MGSDFLFFHWLLQFGEIDIDSDLVTIREDLDPEKEQILMLNNGCLCCTVRDDLVEMLNKLVSYTPKFLWKISSFLQL